MSDTESIKERLEEIFGFRVVDPRNSFGYVALTESTELAEELSNLLNKLMQENGLGNISKPIAGISYDLVNDSASLDMNNTEEESVEIDKESLLNPKVLEVMESNKKLLDLSKTKFLNSKLGTLEKEVASEPEKLKSEASDKKFTIPNLLDSMSGLGLVYGKDNDGSFFISMDKEIMKDMINNGFVEKGYPNVFSKNLYDMLNFFLREQGDFVVNFNEEQYNLLKLQNEFLEKHQNVTNYSQDEKVAYDLELEEIILKSKEIEPKGFKITISNPAVGLKGLLEKKIREQGVESPASPSL